MASTQFLINYLEHFSYIGIFLIVTAVGYLIPIPEEVFLLLVGYIAGAGFYNVYTATFIAILGVLVGDNILFWLSFYNASYVVNKIKKKLKKHRVMKYRHLMRKHIGLAIFASRFIIGLRIFSPFMAGSMNIKWRIFQFYNLLAVLIYVPIIVFLGFHFQNQLALIITGVEFARHLIFFLVLIGLGFLVAYVSRKD